MKIIRYVSSGLMLLNLPIKIASSFFIKNKGKKTKNKDNHKENTLSLNKTGISLRSKIKLYKKRVHEIEAYLIQKPEEWGKFQSEFNSEVNSIFREIMNFEKENVLCGHPEKIHKLKQIFIKRVRGIFLRGDYNQWSFSKPFGYTGDFKIVDDIYQNNPTTTGFERLFDNYFQMTAISVAVRNRKEDFKRIIINFINEREGQKLRIMDLACGSCRDIKEILSSGALVNKNVVFDCYDQETRAIKFAKNLLTGFSNVNFFQKNALRLSVVKDISQIIKEKYDFIYVSGLFDYLSSKICSCLIRNLRKLLNNNGILTVSNVRDKYSNPSIYYMGWLGDWILIYRDDEEFKKIFTEVGFMENELKIQYEQQGIMQYIVASNKSSG